MTQSVTFVDPVAKAAFTAALVDQPCVETAVDLTPRLGRTGGMAFAATDDHLLRVTATGRVPKPRLGQLPEQDGSATDLLPFRSGARKFEWTRMHTH